MSRWCVGKGSFECVCACVGTVLSLFSLHHQNFGYFLLPFLLSFSCVLPDILSRTQQVTGKMRQLQWTCFSFSFLSFTSNFVLLSLTRLHICSVLTVSSGTHVSRRSLLMLERVNYFFMNSSNFKIIQKKIQRIFRNFKISCPRGWACLMKLGIKSLIERR